MMKHMLSTLLVAAQLAAITNAEAHVKRADHHDIANKIRMAAAEPEADADAAPASHQLYKRFNGRMTFYDVGLGACGWWSREDEFVVAVNSAQFGGYAVYPPLICGSSITIEYNGKRVGATVVDECPTCGYGDLDFSRGLFRQFADEGAGVIYANWEFGGGGGGPPPPPPPQETHSEPPPPQTTSSSQQQHTSTSTSTSETSTSSSSSDSQSSTDVVTEEAPVNNNIAQYNLAVVRLGNMILAGGRSA